MDNCDFNPETLIELVKRRPILWDRSLEEHKSRIVISRNWREVCNELNDNFQSLENKEKDEYEKFVIKKWTNLKDNWLKSHKKTTELIKYGAKKIKKYVYYRQMEFLEKNALLKDAEPIRNEDSDSQETNRLPVAQELSEEYSVEIPNLQIDIELLIKLVKGRPILWDKTLYKHRNLSVVAWREIFEELISNFDSLNEREKVEYGREIQKKWANLRDNWVKCYKILSIEKKDRPNYKHRKYVFYDEMMFLKKIFSSSESEEGSSYEFNNETLSESRSNMDHSLTTKRKRGSVDDDVNHNDQFEERVIRILEEHQNTNRHHAFFRSILPSIQKMNEDEIIEFQFGVLNLIKTMKMNSRMNSNFPNLSFSLVSNSYTERNDLLRVHSSLSPTHTIKKENETSVETESDID